MCGICGWLDSNTVDKAILEKMTDSLTHRGPDHKGTEIIDNIGLGHTRLSIIDLSEAGNQPMYNDDRSVCIVFNGEFYSFSKYRTELIKRGYNFKSNSDSEVVLRLYEENGIDFVDDLRGMFALAIWDNNKKELILVRDRIGIKPLYYYEDEARFIFGSELKSVLKHPAVSREIDHNALDAYFRLGYIPCDLSIYKHIKKLKPGHLLRKTKRQTEVRQYWKISRVSGENMLVGEKEATQELMELLEESVRLRLVSDVPVGVFLSGGLDSSIISALAARNSHTKIKTFSIGFNEQRYNELPHARKVADHIGADHHEFIVDLDHTDIITDLAYYYDEPFADSSALPTYMVSKVAREHVKVVLSGDGGDELFGGYNWYSWVLMQIKLKKISGLFRKPLSRMSSKIDRNFKGKHVLKALGLDEYNTYLERTAFFYGEEINYVLTCPDNSFLDSYYKDFYHDSGTDALSRMSRTDFYHYLPDDILTKVDRASMAVSLEARVPMLDHKVCEFAFNLGSDLKIRNNVKKYLLKQVGKELLPSDFEYSRKQGFSIPLREWMQGPLGDNVEDMVNTQDFDGAINKKGVLNMLNHHRAGRSDYGGKLWAVMMLYLWKQNANNL